MIELLWTETAFLAGGFAGNLMISGLAMTLGTLIGAALGRLRAIEDGKRALTAMAWMATNLSRNVPSFVLLFYMAFMLPAEVEIGGQSYFVPLWIKATLALTFPVIGFASDQSLAYFQQSARGVVGAGETFAVAWMQYFLIIIMASATASVIGADEIVGRANTVVARSNDPSFLLVTYAYVSLWFMAAGLVLSGVLRLTVRRAQEAQI